MENWYTFMKCLIQSGTDLLWKRNLQKLLVDTNYKLQNESWIKNGVTVYCVLCIPVSISTILITLVTIVTTDDKRLYFYWPQPRRTEKRADIHERYIN